MIGGNDFIADSDDARPAKFGAIGKNQGGSLRSTWFSGGDRCFRIGCGALCLADSIEGGVNGAKKRSISR
ncbi:hypothetical protein U879_11735 [Defluviimonas sp. 20V17]|nr:hypothetical protein U879_11735 [Defluviimonas sp. 20V17]